MIISLARGCVNISVPGMGYFALYSDTENNVFAIWETNESAKQLIYDDLINQYKSKIIVATSYTNYLSFAVS